MWEKLQYPAMYDLSIVYYAGNKECPEAQVVWNNRFPDDIVPSIISHLNVKDAVRASIVLTRRWRHLLTNLTNLDFGASDLLGHERENKFASSENANKYMKWVNQVLSLNCAPYINEFRVCFALAGFYTGVIDRWVEFAISRHVKKLELDFTVNYHFLYGALYYELSYGVFIKGVPYNNGLNFLTSLCLKFVNINGVLLATILYRCQFLEQLIVENSCRLEWLRVTNSLCRLKQLAIRNCDGFKTLDINMAAAISFKLHCIKNACWVDSNIASENRFVMHGVWNLEVHFVNNDDIRRVDDHNKLLISDAVEGSPCRSDFSKLKSLCLKSVCNTSEAMLESCILSQFRFLERLILEGANELVSMKITSLLCKLKHVEIRCCKKFEKLEIDLLNVVSLKVACTCTAVKLVCIDNPFLLKFDISSNKNFTLSVDIDYVQGINHPCTVECDGTQGMIHSNRGTSFLKSLDFICVNLSRELLEFLLNEFPALERLLVRSSDDLASLKVTESSKCLKYLDICHCQFMKELQVHAPNLKSLAFAWNHRFANVVFGSLPSLVDVLFGEYIQRLLYRLKQIRSFSLQLTKLSLHTTMVVHKDLVIPTFDNVKQLELRVSLRGHQNLVALRCFAEACPLLHELTLEIKWDCSCAMNLTCVSVAESKDDDLTEQDRCTLQHLRKFELDGPFRFSSHVDYEYSFVLYIIRNAIKLEKFVCNTRFSELKFHEIADSSKEQQIDSARQLAKVIPSRVNVEII